MVEIPEFPELNFEEEGHIYRLNGLVIPSVTTLMKPLSDDFYKAVDQAVLERAARKGTAVHRAAENYAKYGIEDIASAYAGYFDGFRRWWDASKPIPLATEAKVYHRILRYAGTSDLLCMIDGRVTMVDYKTSAQMNEMLCRIQMEGYDMAFESHGVKIEERLILHLRRNGSFTATAFPKNTESRNVFSALLTIRNYMNQF